MLAKMTSKNQLTLPRSVTDEIGPSDYFDVEVRNGQIVLTPVRIQRGDAVRAKLAELGLSTADIANAVDWARQPELMVAEATGVYRVEREAAPKPKAARPTPRRKA